MRAFYALTLPTLLEQHCLYVINMLKTQHEFNYCRWTKPEHMHITLRFHAKIEEEKLTEVNALLAKTLPHCESVTLSTRRLLLLPHRKPHMIVLAIHLNEELAKLVRVINDAHTAAGIPLEKRPFLAHITLGRFNESTMHEDFVLNSVKTIEGKADNVVLYKSEPTETGSNYMPLQTFTFIQQN